MPQPIRSPRQAIQTLLLGGVLPVVAFTVIEEYYGTKWGIVAGLVFGFGEVAWEWKKLGKVQPLTLGSNALIFILGGISLVANEGLWFKLQPTIMESVFAFILWGSILVSKPLLRMIMEKQNPSLPPVILNAMKGWTFRVGLFLAFHAALSAWAAVYWSTAAWAVLKGVGFTVSMILYMVIESLWLRRKIKRYAQDLNKVPNSSR